MKKILVIIMSALLLIESGCSVHILNNKKANIIESSIDFLTSKEQLGRLTGTIGNVNVEKYISKIYKDIGLEDYLKNDYYQEYNQEYYNPDNQTNEMVIHLKDGTIKKCIYGIDFMPMICVNNIDINCPLTANKNDRNIYNSAVTIEDEKDRQELYNKAKCILLKKDIFKKTLGVQEQGMPIIQINSELYELIKTKGSSMELRQKYINKDVTARNIIGRIKGKNSSNAVIISAHFDHVGCAANNVYAGSLDNASGIALLLDIAYRLKEISQKTPLGNDIIICAFNGEESGRLGSIAFFETFKNTYKSTVNINLDSIGSKARGNLMITSGRNTKNLYLINNLKEYFEEKQIRCIVKNDGSYISDDITFSEHDIPSITVAQENTSIIHTANDKPELLDFKYLNNMGDILTKYIININGEFLQNQEKTNTALSASKDKANASISEEEKENELKKMEFNSYKLINKGNTSILLYKDTGEFNNIIDVKKYFPNIKIPEKIDEYILKNILIVINNAEIDMLNTEPNKIYVGKDLTKDDVKFISIEYKNKSKENELLQFNVYYKTNSNGIELSDVSDNNINNIIETMNVGNEKFNILRNKKSSSIVSIETTFNKNNPCFVSILKLTPALLTIEGKKVSGHKPAWENTSNKEIADFLSENKIVEFLKNILTDCK